MLLFNSLGNLYHAEIDRKKDVAENIINNANGGGHLWKRYSFLLEGIKGMIKTLFEFIQEDWEKLQETTVDDNDWQKLTLPYLHALLLGSLFFWKAEDSWFKKIIGTFFKTHLDVEGRERLFPIFWQYVLNAPERRIYTESLTKFLNFIFILLGEDENKFPTDFLIKQCEYFIDCGATNIARRLFEVVIQRFSTAQGKSSDVEEKGELDSQKFYYNQHERFYNHCVEMVFREDPPRTAILEVIKQGGPSSDVTATWLTTDGLNQNPKFMQWLKEWIQLSGRGNEKKWLFELFNKIIKIKLNKEGRIQGKDSKGFHLFIEKASQTLFTKISEIQGVSMFLNDLYPYFDAKQKRIWIYSDEHNVPKPKEKIQPVPETIQKSEKIVECQPNLPSVSPVIISPTLPEPKIKKFITKNSSKKLSKKEQSRMAWEKAQKRKQEEKAKSKSKNKKTSKQRKPMSSTVNEEEKSVDQSLVLRQKSFSDEKNDQTAFSNEDLLTIPKEYETQEDDSSADEKGDTELSKIPSKNNENSRKKPITLFWGDKKKQTSEAQGVQRRILHR